MALLGSIIAESGCGCRTGGQGCRSDGVVGGQPADHRLIGGLDLQRHMADAEALLQFVLSAPKQGFGRDAFGAHEVRGQRRLGRAHAPDMQVVDGGDAGQRTEIIGDGVALDAGRHGMQGEIDRVPQYRPGADDDDDADREADRRIEPQPAGHQNEHAGKHDAQCHRGIGSEMQKGGPDIEGAQAPEKENQRCRAIDDDPDRGDDDDRHPGERLRRLQAADCLPGDPAGDDQQQDGIAERHEDRAAAEAVGVAPARPALAENRGAPRRREGEHVAEIVPGIGKQRERVRGDPVKPLGDAVGGGERHADGESASEIRRSSAVRCAAMRPMRAMQLAMIVGMIEHAGNIRSKADSYRLRGPPGRVSCSNTDRGQAMALGGSNGIAARSISAEDARAMLRDGSEIALLDVREEGVFSEDGHPFFANSVPLSRLELLVRDLVPRKLTRIVVYDGGDENLADRAAAKLTRMGYRDVAVMAGGTRGWAAAGYELFTGVNVPSKAFGELVEHRCETPHINAAELKRRLDAGEKVLIVDSRPIGEFRNMSIPGAFDCPGAELVYRVPDQVPSSDTLVVVNCAGRTRSIIGAQSLRNAGLPNPVLALENGTMGWELAGLELARGREEALPAPSPEGLRRAQDLADKVAERFAIRHIDDAALSRFQAEAEERTLYLFDVRSPEEYIAGHLAGARSAPGGQLVQATDVYMATRNARIVLTDDDGVRAVMTGSWLVQMGWPEVYVLAGGLKGRQLVQGMPKPVIPELDTAAAATILPAELQALVEKGEASVVDLAPSLAYEAGHIPGAWFAVRAQLPGSLDQVPKRRVLVLTSPDAALARLAAARLRRARSR